MLTDEMQTLIRRFSAGAVATVNADGTPSVSPKGTFVVLDDRTLAFGHIRSPGTVANLRRNPAIEVCFTDVVTRRAVRVTGTAAILRQGDADAALDDTFEAAWGPFRPHMGAYVRIAVTAAEMIFSPAYDLGLTEDELRKTYLERLNTY
ncbi:MAG: pyridoxamine 5'-phosphate oxidase family protein [Rhodospirillaceae bacterium]|nr:pyridoxamine 5'-phosphate oxidase family protein [Rhodospirillaceae bacterium]